MPEYSIVIPVYNAAMRLRDCLDAIRRQDVTDWECLCVDDGSTDASGAILDEYAALDGRFIVVHQANVGPGSARNAGLMRVRGTWVSFVDADDYVDADYLSSFARIADKADINFTGVRLVYRDGVRKAVTLDSGGVVSNVHEIGRYLWCMGWNEAGLHFLGFACNKFYRVSLIRAQAQPCFPEALRICEDEIFLLKCLEHTASIRVDPAVTYNYQSFGAGLTQAGDRWLVSAARHYQAVARETTRDFIRSIAERRCLECCLGVFASARPRRELREALAISTDFFAASTNRMARTVTFLRFFGDWAPLLLLRILVRLSHPLELRMDEARKNQTS